MKLKISEEKLQTVWSAVDSVVKKLAENPNLAKGAAGIAANVAIGGAVRQTRIRRLRDALFSVIYEVSLARFATRKRAN